MSISRVAPVEQPAGEANRRRSNVPPSGKHPRNGARIAASRRASRAPDESKVPLRAGTTPHFLHKSSSLVGRPYCWPAMPLLPALSCGGYAASVLRGNTPAL